MRASVEVEEGAKEDFLRRHARDAKRAAEAWKALVRMGTALERDPFFGTQIPKDRFPKRLKDDPNLWKLDLPHAFRAVYTVMGRSGAPRLRVVVR